jgi:hypothetical protein
MLGKVLRPVSLSFRSLAVISFCKREIFDVILCLHCRIVWWNYEYWCALIKRRSERKNMSQASFSFQIVHFFNVLHFFPNVPAKRSYTRISPSEPRKDGMSDWNWKVNLR